MGQKLKHVEISCFGYAFLLKGLDDWAESMKVLLGPCTVTFRQKKSITQSTGKPNIAGLQHNKDPKLKVMCGRMDLNTNCIESKLLPLHIFCFLWLWWVNTIFYLELTLNKSKSLNASWLNTNTLGQEACCWW